MPIQKPSIIFNQYAKKAIEKGWIPASIKKTASEKEKVVPTGELIIDFPILIAQLRNKGLYEQASNLEQKFILYKQAETHLYRVHDEDGEDVLNLAHPGKNVEIGKASDGLGVVNSLLEKHDKMVGVLSKKPTGKYAEFIRDIVVEAAEILHPELARFAQDAGDDLEKIDYDLNTDEETKKKIEGATNLVSESLGSLPDTLTAIINTVGVDDSGTLLEWADFTEKKLLNGVGVNLFLQTNKISKENFEKMKDVIFSLFGSGEITAEAVSKKIFSLKSFEAILGYFNAIDPNIADRYFGGSVIKDVDKDDNSVWNEIATKAQTDRRFVVRPESIWVADLDTIRWSHYMNNARVGAVSAEIVKFVSDLKSKIINEASLQNAKNALIAVAKPIYDHAKKLNANLEPNGFLKNNRILKTTGLAVGSLQASSGEISIIRKLLEKGSKVYTDAGLPAVPANLNAGTAMVQKSLNDLITKLSVVNLSSVFDSPIEESLANQITGTFDSISRIWLKYSQSNTVKEEDKEIVKANVVEANNISAIIKSNKNKPWAFIQKLISGTYPKVNAPEKLFQVGQEALKYAQSSVPQTKGASDNNQIKKEAFQPLSGKPVAQPSSGGSKPQTQSSGQSGNPALAKANLSDPTQLAVANMQLALNVFGQIISNPDAKVKFPKANFDPNDGLRIIGTGPKANPHINMFDGHWGPNTDAALVLANKYLQSIGSSVSTGVKWNQGSRSHSTGTEEAAKANSIALSKAISYVKGEKSSDKSGLPDSTVFDSLPETINWSADPGEASLTGEQQTVKLTKASLASLRSFYDFLTKNRLREAETSGASETEIGTEGFTPKSWNVVFQWFQRRAVLKYQSAKAIGEVAANQAKEYFNSVKRLSNIYDKMLSVYSKFIKEDTVINPGLIDEFSRKVQSGEISGKPGENGTDEAQVGMWLKSKKKVNKPGQIGSDGERIKSPEERGNTLPFADTINFRDEELFSDFDAGGNKLVQLADMQKVPGPRMAQMLFAGSATPKMAQKAAIKMLGQNPAENGWNDELNTWFVQSGKKLVPATQLLSPQDITNVTQQIMQNAPINKYRTFLNNLSIKMKEVMQEWSEDAPEALIVRLSSYYKYWQQAIAKQLRDLAR